MQTTFAVLGHLSKSKGRVTEEDIQLANQLMNQMQLDESHRKLAQEAFSRGKATDFPATSGDSRIPVLDVDNVLTY